MRSKGTPARAYSYAISFAEVASKTQNAASSASTGQATPPYGENAASASTKPHCASASQLGNTLIRW